MDEEHHRHSGNNFLPTFSLIHFYSDKTGIMNGNVFVAFIYFVKGIQICSIVSFVKEQSDMTNLL